MLKVVREKGLFFLKGVVRVLVYFLRVIMEIKCSKMVFLKGWMKILLI